MKQHLQIKASQHLALTPRLQQSIRLLQLSTLELAQEINQFLQDNPMLERADEAGAAVGEMTSEMADAATGEATNEMTSEAEPAPAGEAESDRDFADAVYADLAWGDRPQRASGDDDDEREFQATDRGSTSLARHLAEQIALMPLGPRDRGMAALLIEALDEDGYLSAPLEELLPLLDAGHGVELDELHAVLRLIQSLDPAGVGARDLAECLALQLDALPEDTPALAAARRLVREHLPLLAEREYGKLKKLLGLDGDRELAAVRQLIVTLNPRPGARFGEADPQYVVPDVVVKKRKGDWVVSLNPQAMPRLRVNELYAGILRQADGGGPLAGQLQEARWLIKNVQQRFQTILRVAQCIVTRQRQFFEQGDIAMRPLVLREVADELGLHESTISRVTAQKYMMTPRGLYEFKYFFGSAVATEAGGAAASTAIRALIRQLVEAEPCKQPLSDQAIAGRLAEQGYVVARRTVAKYREQLNIPPANQRKTY